MSQSESKMSRRQFMGVAGGVLGSTAVLANTARSYRSESSTSGQSAKD